MDRDIALMEALLTEEDRRELLRIHEPRIVAVPPMDTRNSLCVMPDGEIRAYGLGDKSSFEDFSDTVYIASRDCGLSWKKHRETRVVAGSCTRLKNGKYLSVVTASGSNTGLWLKKKGITCGAWAVISDSPDSVDFRLVRIADEEIFDEYLPVELMSGRIACTGQIYADNVNRCVFMWSDDGGESWGYTVLPDAPVHEMRWPHKGIRWQNRTSECTLPQKNDGTLWILARTSQDDFWEFFSHDDGRTWEGPVKSVFHGTLTSPKTMKLSDGRLLCCFNDTQALPELDHEKQTPYMSQDERNGRWEDVFTNRDANHAAISCDDGRTWQGFREMALNVIRNDSDYRTKGPLNDSRDKSVHQFQMLELPMNRVLVSYGQNDIARKLIIFDIDWLLETERHENFRQGLGNVSTQVYLKSVSGGFRMAGHCSWNRTNGAVLMPDPEENFEEALFLSRIEDPRLFSATQGVVWNFPAATKGRVDVKMRVDGEPVTLSLTDRWYNPIDEVLPYFAEACLMICRDMLPEERYSLVSVEWDCDEKRAVLYRDEKKLAEMPLRGKAECGLCYLILQGSYSVPDERGAWIKELHMKAL